MDTRNRYDRKTERIKSAKHFENSKFTVSDIQCRRIFHIDVVRTVLMHQKSSLLNIINNIVR